MLNKIFIFLLFSLLWVTNLQASPLINYYHVQIPEDNHKVAFVEAQLTLQSKVLSMSQNGPMPDRWPQFVKNLRVATLNDTPIKTQWGNHHWTVQTSQGQTIKLFYQVELDHESLDWPGGTDGVAFAREWGIFYTGRALFVHDSAIKTSYQVEFVLPQGWKVSTPWQPQSGSEAWQVTNATDLLESMIFAGTHEEHLLSHNEFTMVFVLGGKTIQAQKEFYLNLANGVLDYYIDLMGSIPLSSNGSPLSRMIVIMGEGPSMDGEVIGSHINIVLNPNGPPEEELIAKFVFAHEFFHLWNGKTIRVASTQENWFSEGFTNYYTFKALKKVGVINEQVWFGIMNNLMYQRYINDPKIGQLAMRDAASGFDKDNHWGLIYGGGLFVSICQDLTIRENSKNQKSLDDIMRYLFQAYGKPQKRITTDELQDLFTEYSGKDQSNFFKTYVAGPSIVPIDQCLQKAGLQATVANKSLSITIPDDLSPQQQAILNAFFGG